jgi:4-oxalocrotonate tautomerase
MTIVSLCVILRIGKFEIAARTANLHPVHGASPRRGEESMPLIQVKLIEEVFTPQQKQQMISKLTDAMVAIEGENMRKVTWVIIEDVKSGEWGIGGQSISTEAVKAIAAGKA